MRKFEDTGDWRNSSIDWGDEHGAVMAPEAYRDSFIPEKVSPRPDPSGQVNCRQRSRYPHRSSESTESCTSVLSQSVSSMLSVRRLDPWAVEVNLTTLYFYYYIDHLFIHKYVIDGHPNEIYDPALAMRTMIGLRLCTRSYTMGESFSLLCWLAASAVTWVLSFGLHIPSLIDRGPGFVCDNVGVRITW